MKTFMDLKAGDSIYKINDKGIKSMRIAAPCAINECEATVFALEGTGDVLKVECSDLGKCTLGRWTCDISEYMSELLGELGLLKRDYNVNLRNIETKISECKRILGCSLGGRKGGRKGKRVRLCDANGETHWFGTQKDAMKAIGCRSTRVFGKLLLGIVSDINGWTLVEYDKLF